MITNRRSPITNKKIHNANNYLSPNFGVRKIISNNKRIYWYLSICFFLCIYSILCISEYRALGNFIPSIAPPKATHAKRNVLPRIIYFNTNSIKHYIHQHREIKNEVKEEELMKDQFRNSRSLPIDDAPCIPMEEWQTLARPTCNVMHEISMTNDVSTLLGIGGWRLAWKILKEVGDGDEDLIVLKTLNTRTRFDEVTFYQHFVDAAVSNHFSSSKYTLDVYGFCGQSILNEFASTTLEDLIVKYKRTNDYYDMPSIQKAVIAREVSLALGELHGVDENVTIVHKDLKPSNVFVMKDGSVKMGDFNLSELLRWNVTAGRQCIFRRRINNAVSYRSPEEAREERLTEKIDVYSLGSILFKIITGATPYYETNQMDEKFAKIKLAQKMLMNNQMPMLPSRYGKIKDEIMLEMFDIMHDCHILDGSVRPSAGEVANRLVHLAKGVDKEIVFSK